jgi:3-hydroxyisobutyrate dehydrogenase-like beta-hydroxyacid dehydrogenase
LIVVVGLGAMGSGIGLALRSRGFEVAGVEPSPERRHAWRERSGLNASERLDGVDVATARAILVVVRSEIEVSEVLDALPAVFAPPVMVISTLSIGYARLLGERTGLRVIEAPVSGGIWGAERGEMSMFLHAPGGLRAEESEVITAITSTRTPFPRYGTPAAAKLVNNALGAMNAWSTARMLDVAAELGLDRDVFLEIVARSSGQSWMADHFRDFPLDLLAKDVRLLLQDIAGLPLVRFDDELTPAVEGARRRLDVER